MDDQISPEVRAWLDEKDRRLDEEMLHWRRARRWYLTLGALSLILIGGSFFIGNQDVRIAVWLTALTLAVGGALFFSVTWVRFDRAHRREIAEVMAVAMASRERLEAEEREQG